MLYAVKVRETLSRTVVTEADSFEDALSKVEGAYRNSSIILEADDYDDTEYLESETFGTAAIPDDNPDLAYFEQIK